MSVKNIVLFGQSGAGKSSVVNLIAGREVAETSLDMVPCTMHWKEHPITFDGYTYNVFDTMGLEENKLEKKQYLDAITNAYNLIAKLQDEGGIHMLLFCVRAGRFTSPIQNNYRLFYEFFCEKKVPIGLVLTGLEREPDMDNWWTKFKSSFDDHGVLVDGHACITAVNGPDERHQQLYEESRRLVCDLVIHHTRRCQEGNGYNGGDPWFMKLVGKLKEFLLRKHIPTKNNIVKVLTKRCNIPEQAAVDLAKQIIQDRERRNRPLTNIFVR